MGEIKILKLDKYELGILVNALFEYRNQLIKESKDTDLINEVLTKAIDAPKQKKSIFKLKEER